MTKSQTREHPLFAVLDGGSEPRTVLDVQTPRVANFEAHKVKTGRSDVQTRSVERPDESQMPSRIKNQKCTVWIDRQQHADVIAELRNTRLSNGKEPTRDMVIADGLRLWLAARAKTKLDVQTPACSSCGCCGDCNTTTATLNTLGAQAPNSPPLPGFAARILEMNRAAAKLLARPLPDRPILSAHSREINWAYALASPTIGNPHGFVEGKKGNLWSGQYDGMIDLWLVANEDAETELSRRLEQHDQQSRYLEQRAGEAKADYDERRRKWESK